MFQAETIGCHQRAENSTLTISTHRGTTNLQAEEHVNDHIFHSEAQEIVDPELDIYESSCQIVITLQIRVDAYHMRGQRLKS